MIRICITHMHGDHAHYEMKLDNPTEHDEIIKTDKDIDILLHVRNFWMVPGLNIFMYLKKALITNPSKEPRGHHHH